MTGIDLVLLCRGETVTVRGAGVVTIEKGIERAETDYRRVIEIAGRNGYLYDYPKAKATKTPQLVYAREGGFGYKMGKWSSTGNLNPYIVATHILRAAWYTTSAPDCSIDHKRKPTGHVCDAIELAPCTSQDPAVIRAHQRLADRVHEAVARVAGQIPDRETRKEAEIRWTARAAGNTDDMGRPADAPDAPPARLDPSSDELDLENLARLSDTLHVEQPPWLTEEPPQESMPGPDFEDPALRLQSGSAKPLEAAASFSVVQETLSKLGLGGSQDQVFTLIRETVTSSKVVREVVISKGVNPDAHVALHRLYSRADHGANGSLPSQTLNPDTVWAWYKKNPIGGGTTDVVLGVYPKGLPPLARNGAEFQRWRNAFYTAIHSQRFLTLSGGNVGPVADVAADGTNRGIRRNEYGEEILAVQS